MLITRKNGFKNTLIHQKLWPKQVTDQNYGHFLCILNNHVSSELIFMFLFMFLFIDCSLQAHRQTKKRYRTTRQNQPQNIWVLTS